MRRSVLLISLVVLSLSGQAQAKGLVSLSLCGTNGCHTTRDKQALSDAMDTAAQADPGRTGAFFKLRLVFGEPGAAGFPESRQLSYWFPALRVVRGDSGVMSGWMMPVPATQRVLRRLRHGLTAFPAAALPPVDPNAQERAIADSVGYPHLNPPAPRQADGGGTSWAWWLLLALVPAGLVFALRARRRWI